MLLLGCLMLLSACSKYALVDCETYDYYDCQTFPSENGQLEVRVSFPDGMDKVPIVVLRGEYPSSDTVMLDTLVSETRTYSLAVSTSYSVQAEYRTPDRLIYAIDGDEISQKSYTVCDSVCYLVKDAKTDLRLKY